MEIRNTDDGSQTIWSPVYQETYHSAFGAVTESNHVFIESGLRQLDSKVLKVFEMGFGTGLNALLTYKEAITKNLQIEYLALELNPLPAGMTKNFKIEEYHEVFQKMHESEWNRKVTISPFFMLEKLQIDLNLWNEDRLFDLIYFDAFSPETQPELWTQEVFVKMFNILYKGGILTTYCAKGNVRRNMLAAGFGVERLPGPPGKREILRARK